MTTRALTETELAAEYARPGGYLSGSYRHPTGGHFGILPRPSRRSRAEVEQHQRQERPGTRTISDEQLHALVASSRPYTLVLLRWGPRRHAEDLQSVVWEHGRRNAALQADGIMPIICPVGDDTLVGAGVFTTDPERTREIMDDDPGVRAGVFTYEIHPCRSFPGSTLPAPTVDAAATHGDHLGEEP